MLRTGLVLFALVGPGTQAPADLPAERARAAWLRHDFAGLLVGARRVVIQLPGGQPASTLSAEQAVAVFHGFTRRAREVEVSVQAARIVDEEQGYLVLRRSFQVVGVSETMVQWVFVSYQWEGSGSEGQPRHARAVEVRIVQ